MHNCSLILAKITSWVVDFNGFLAFGAAVRHSWHEQICFHNHLEQLRMGKTWCTWLSTLGLSYRRIFVLRKICFRNEVFSNDEASPFSSRLYRSHSYHLTQLGNVKECLPARNPWWYDTRLSQFRFFPASCSFSKTFLYIDFLLDRFFIMFFID